MQCISNGSSPQTVSFCKFPSSSLVLNYFNDPEKDIDLAYCKELGIRVCRVMASGGPVFGDTGYIFTFLHLRRENPKVPPHAAAMFEKTLSGIAQKISSVFRVESRYRPLNDLEVRCNDGKWRKVGPSSCFYDDKAIQMGSGLQVKKPDVDLMARVIPTPPEKWIDKEAKTVQERVTYLEEITKSTIDLDCVKTAYKEAIEEIFEVRLEVGEMSPLETQVYAQMEERYTNDQFFMERSEKVKLGLPPLGVTRRSIQFKVPGGPFMRIVLFVHDGVILDALITGGIHASPSFS